MSAVLILLPIFAYAAFFRDYFRKSVSVSIFFSITSIISLEFVFGILNLLKYGSFLLFYSGVGVLLFMFLKHKRELYDFFLSTPVVIYTLVSLFYLYVMQGAEFFFWDEYSHWGIFIKEMFYFDKLYDASSMAAHLNYPPGISLWSYFLVSNLFFSEANVYFAYFLLLFASTLMMYESLKVKDLHWIVLVFVVQMVLFATFGHWFSSIYVDHVIGAMFAGLILSYLSDEYRYKELFLFLPSLVAIVLVKEIGLYFGVAFLGFVLFYEILKRKSIKKEHLKLFGVLLVLALSMAVTLKVWSYRQESLGVKKEHQSISGIVDSLLSDKRVLDAQKELEVKKRFWDVVLNQQLHKEELSLKYNEFSYSLMPQYKKSIKLSTLGVMIFYLFMIATLLFVIKEHNSRVKVAFVYGYMLFVSLIYLFILYFSFLVAFGEGALRIPSFVRYMNMAILPMLFVGFFVMMPVMKLHSKKLFLVASGFIFVLIFITKPYIKPLYTQMKVPIRKQLDALTSNVVSNVKKGSKIFVVFGGGANGSIANMFRYSLVPLKSTISKKDFISKTSSQMLKEYMKYDYVWFVSINRELVQKNRFIFKSKGKGELVTLYKVKKEPTRVVFEAVY